MRHSPAVGSPVAAVRHFNRFYTRKIGVLDDGLLDSDYSLTEVRVLFEIAHRPGVIARELERGLNLDPGYLSRILRRFAKQRLVRRVRSKSDGRQMALELTPAGSRIFAHLNRRSSEQVDGLIGHLSSGDKDRLVGLMHSVRHLLSAPGEIEASVIVREPKAGELGWVVQRHGAIYAQEYGWSVEFEGLVAKIVGEYVEQRQPDQERCWIAELDGEPVGCVFLVRQDAAVAKLRLLLVEPSARGHGIGQKLVEECVRFARAAGYRRVQLWTNSVLTAARRIYERAGFRLVEAKPHHSFGHDLVGETWQLDLTTTAV